MLNHSDTIVAVSTAPGAGAIAVIRLSGPESWNVVAKVARVAPSAFRPRFASLRSLFDASGSLIDKAVVTCYSRPYSYTGEDLAEISCHGGIATVRALYKALTEAGARAAQPGEFTRRAFVNGKMDLAQAEAVNALIRSRTRMQMTAAQETLSGALSVRVRDVSNSLTEIAAVIEASIDFPEDVDEPDRSQIVFMLEDCERRLAQALELSERGRMLSEGIRLAIVGRPNVGKSSLLNLLAGRQRAIVSEIPGTTRDFLEETVEIGGLPVLAVDTAGIRDTTDPIEHEGARRAVEMMKMADIALVVLDASQGVTQEDRNLLCEAGENAVVVWNKIDLKPVDVVSDEALTADTRQVRICALTGEGLEELQAAAFEGLGYGSGFFEEALAASQRQTQLLAEALELVGEARVSAESVYALDLAAIQLQTARRKLGEITGEDAFEDMLDVIFSSFCIGK